MSTYSNNISNSCNDVSHESIKVQYNVDICEIGKENKDNLSIKIPKSCIKSERKSKNIFREIQTYNHFKNISYSNDEVSDESNEVQYKANICEIGKENKVNSFYII